jgi:hypothetical protein
MKMGILAVLLAGTAFGSIIPVTGSGTFAMDDTTESSASLFFSGSDGVDSVSFGGVIPVGTMPFTSLEGSVAFDSPALGYNVGFQGGTIDGVTSDLWSVSIGNGAGNLTIFDPSGDGVVLASQDISGFIATTSYMEDGTRFFPDGQFNSDWSASGTFTIGAVDSADAVNAVPEASSGMLLGLGMLLIWPRTKRLSRVSQ